MTMWWLVLVTQITPICRHGKSSSVWMMAKGQYIRHLIVWHIVETLIETVKVKLIIEWHILSYMNLTYTARYNKHFFNV